MTIRVLVVDDDRELLSQLEARLQDEGYEVLTAVHGKDGLNQLGLVHIDGILLDVAMPEMDGLAMLREIAHHVQHLPVIMMSETNQIESVEVALRLGAMDYLLKPIDFDLLIQKCARLFG